MARRALRRRLGHSRSRAIVEARAEVRRKSKAQIDRETAEKWAARAVAADELFRSTGDEKWRTASVEFAHEAVEHAASGTPGSLAHVRRMLPKRR